MHKKDLRREQIALLKHEQTLTAAAKKLAGNKGFDRKAVIASAAAASAVAIAAADKLAQPALADFAALNDAAATQTGENLLIALAHVATSAHAAFESAAMEAGFILLAQGGTPKEPPARAVLSALGIS